MDVRRIFYLATKSDALDILLSGTLLLSLSVGYEIGLMEAVHAGTLEGTVHYVGVQPSPRVLPVTKDQDHCGTEVSIQTVHLHDAHGALSDAVVSVEGIEEQVNPEQVEHSVLNMRCSFSPRIATARMGQEIEIRNEDPILHNTHIKYGKRTFLNVAQVPGGKPIVKRLKRSGVHDIRCDKHVFMEGYLHVFSHPFYALTTQTGAFRITGIPAGKHPIHLWHETLGVLEQVVTIPENGTVRVDFTYP